MSVYLGASIVSKSDMIPACHTCSSNDSVILVDSTLTSDATYADGHDITTMPVWHCSRCNKLFGERTWAATNAMAAGNNRTFHVDNTSTVSKWDLDWRLKNVENTIGKLQEGVDKLQIEITQQKEDILLSLRNRVSQFTLS